MTQASAPIAAIRIKNILFATDFSEVSANAIPYLACIARHFGATVFPIHVIPGEPRYEIPMDRIAEELEHSRHDAEHALADFVGAAPLDGVPKQILVRRGDVWPAISEAIEQHDIDMIVMGTRGHSGFGKIVFGSVAEQIFRQAACPVLVVGRHAATHQVEDGLLYRVLFATDTSHESLQALPFVVDLANSFGAFLKLLAVVDVNTEGMYRCVDEVVAHKTHVLEDVVAGLRLVHAPEIFIEIGSVADSILKTAALNNVDLVAMATHASATPAAISHVAGAITPLVAAHAQCPVLTVRVGDHWSRA